MKLAKDFLKQRQIIKDKPIIISVSGGLDSMSLLNFLHEKKFKLICVHFNHHKRNESEMEAKLVEDFCKEKNIIFLYHDIEIEGNNFQAKARNKRKLILEKVAKKYKTPYIATAHHLDDLLETILMKIIRGSNLLGYSGMDMFINSNGFTYIKPFLFDEKKQLEKYAKDNLIPYSQDSSNYSFDYLRNRIRLTIVPILKQENDNLLSHVKQFSKQLKHSFNFLRQNSLKYLKKTENNIIVDTFKKLEKGLQYDIISALLENNNINVNYNLIIRIRKLILKNKPSAKYYLSNDYVLVKTYNRVSIYKNSDLKNDFKEVLYDIDDRKYSNFKYYFFHSRKKADFSCVITYDQDKLLFPLKIRNKRIGDILHYPYGSKKLKKLFIDNKIDIETRKKILFVVDSNDTIVYIPKYYKNDTLGTTNTLTITYKDKQNLFSNKEKK